MSDAPVIKYDPFGEAERNRRVLEKKAEQAVRNVPNKLLPELAESLLDYMADAKNAKHRAAHKEQNRQAVLYMIEQMRAVLNRIAVEHAG